MIPEGLTPEEELDFKQAAALVQLFINHPRTGEPKWRGGGFLDLYFPNGHRLDVRRALIEVWKTYFKTFQDNDELLWYYLPNNGNRLQKISDRQFPKHFDEIVGTIEEDLYFDGSIEAYMTPSEKRYNWPPLWYTCGAGVWDREPNKLSDNEAYFPTLWLMKDPMQLVRLALRFCNLLKPRHGLGGLSVIYSSGSTPYYERNDQAYPALKRYPGLDYVDGAVFKLVTRRVFPHKIRGSNWLTVLDNEFITELGGRTAIEQQLAQDPEVVIHDWDGGILIQAGPRPQLGDVNAGRDIKHYGTVARMVKPIRFEGYKQGYFRVPKPLDEVTETLKWIRRFDE